MIGEKTICAYQPRAAQDKLERAYLNLKNWEVVFQSPEPRTRITNTSTNTESRKGLCVLYVLLESDTKNVGLVNLLRQNLFLVWTGFVHTVTVSKASVFHFTERVEQVCVSRCQN